MTGKTKIVQTNLIFDSGITLSSDRGSSLSRDLQDSARINDKRFFRLGIQEGH